MTKSKIELERWLADWSSWARAHVGLDLDDAGLRSCIDELLGSRELLLAELEQFRQSNRSQAGSVESDSAEEEEIADIADELAEMIIRFRNEPPSQEEAHPELVACLRRIVAVARLDPGAPPNIDAGVDWGTPTVPSVRLYAPPNRVLPYPADFPSIGCRLNECAFESRGVSLMCIAHGCGRMLHPGDDLYKLVVAYYKAVDRELAEQRGEAPPDE